MNDIIMTISIYIGVNHIFNNFTTFTYIITLHNIKHKILAILIHIYDSLVFIKKRTPS